MDVDAHTHYLPEPFRDLLREWEKPVRIEERDGQEFVVHTTGSFPLFPGFTDLDARVEWMDEHGIDVTLMSVSTPNPNEGPFSVEKSTELVRAINDGYAAAQREYPDHVAGLGALPLRDPDAALAELDRIAGDLDLAGVAVPTAVRGEKLSKPELAPVFDRIEELDLTVFVHPGRNELSHTLDDDEWFFTPLGVFPMETTIQVGRLVFDGFFDRHDLTMVLSHMGGALPYLVGRFERGRDQFRSDPDESPERPILEYVESFYYDTISFHEPAYHAAIETVGTDHLLFGTDYPFGMEKAEWSLRDVDRLDLSEDERRAVMGETAADLFGL